MPYEIKYQMEVKNFEQQLVKLLLEDTFSLNTNPYGLSYTRTNDAGPNQTIEVAFTSIPAGCTGTRIDALDSNGTLVGTSGTLGTTSPVSWSGCPDGDHTFMFFFLIPTPGDDEYFVLNEINGVTYDLTPSDDPFHIITDNTSEDKLGGLAALQLRAEFMSDTENNLNKLLQGNYSDRRYRATATINDKTFFKGFLQMADANEAFLPHPNPISLTATCGLASLKNKPLTDFTAANPSGYFSIIKFVAWCLNKTGLPGNIYVSFRVKETDFAQFANETIFTASHTITLKNCSKNIYAGQKLIFTSTVSNNNTFTVSAVAVSGADLVLTVVENVTTESLVMAQIEFLNNNWFNTLFLDSKTFEDEPGTSLDCYTVLERIAKMYFRIGQRHGEWWIKCIDEYDGGPEVVTVFDEEGDWVEVKAATSYLKSIGIAESMKWSGHSADVAFTSPARFAKLVYRYENPAEIPCNIDLERGDYIADISADSKKYEIDCWELLKNVPPGTAPSTDAYIRRDFINGYENARYVVFEFDAAGHFLISENIPVEAKGKIVFDLVRRMSADVSGSGFYRAHGLQIRLYGSDGTYWLLRGETSGGDTIGWEQSNSNFSTNIRYVYFEGDVSDDLRDPVSLYGEKTTPPLPVAGYVRILIYQNNLTSWGSDTYIDKLEFDYIPFINGVHQKFKGQHHKLNRSSEDIEQVDDEINISDAPSRLLKGALHKYNGSDHELAGLFWNQKTRENPLNSTETKPFGWHQAQAVWNQVRSLQRIFRGRIQGIESDSVDGDGKCDLPTCFHDYQLTDTDAHTSGKIFVLLSYDIDLKRCEFSQCSFKESAVTKVYTDDYEFKYLTK